MLGLKNTILGKDRAEPNTPKAEEVGKGNELAYTELCCCLDDNTLMPILYKALINFIYFTMILKHCFISEEKTHIVGLYMELTNIVKTGGEEIVDYLTPVEKLIAALSRAKEMLSDALLGTMVLKGLTDEYDPFRVHVTQMREALTFKEFKARLRSFECMLCHGNRPCEDKVMVTKHKNIQPNEEKKKKEGKYFNENCFLCVKNGYQARDYRYQKKKNQRNYKQPSIGTRDNSKTSTLTEFVSRWQSGTRS